MPADALRALAAQLRDEDSVITPRVAEPSETAALGALAAAGPRAAAEGPAYALVVESVREGYLLHYGEPRVVVGADRDLRLLAGDYLYALGLERLAALGDLHAVRALSDLISLSAALHADGAGRDATADALWLATATAIAVGEDATLERAKSSLRAGENAGAPALWQAARQMAAEAGLADPLARAAAGIDFRPSEDRSELG